MAVEFVDGFQGKPHVTADDVGGFKAGVVGSADYVLNTGKKLEATVISNNKIRIAEGEVVMQGRHWRVKPGTYEDLTIDNGTQGMNRKDAIVARYTKESSSGIENVEIVVLKGTPVADTPTAPVPTKGDIRSGAIIHEMLLYIVEIKRLNVESVTKEFNEVMTADEIKEMLTQLNSKLKAVETGNYGTQWKINQTDYYSIGGKQLLNQDPDMYVTDESKITVKKSGVYLVILNAYTYSTSGGGTLWGRIVVNNVAKLQNAARCQGYAGLNLVGILQLNASDKIDGELSVVLEYK